MRNLLFREVILSFLGADSLSEEPKKQDPTSIYCQSCKQAHKDIDCSKCDKKIEVTKDVGQS
jgi:hypothetical protein